MLGSSLWVKRGAREKSALLPYPGEGRGRARAQKRESEANRRRGERHRTMSDLKCAARADFELELVKVGVDARLEKRAKSLDTC